MDRIKQIFTSYKTTLILLVIYAILMALGTYIEEIMSTTAAKILIYYSPVFILLHLLMVVNFLFVLVEKRLLQSRRWALFVIHGALIIILIGAMTTHIFGKEGTVRIREGEKSNIMVSHTNHGVFEHPLPFTLELVEFRMIRYPGSNSPSSYESDLKMYVGDEVKEATIFMNNVIDLEGYRLFQSSYDEDEMGTILSVNQDVAGRAITYLGYTLLVIGFILMFVLPNSRLRRLNRRLNQIRGAAVAVGLFFSSSLFAQDFTHQALFQSVERSAVPVEHAQKFGETPVQLRGRIVPMNTFSSEILRKLHKKERIGKLNSDQFLLSLMTDPHTWMQIPLIAVKNEELSRHFELPEKYVSYIQLFDDERAYKLMDRLAEASHKPMPERNTFDKDLIKLDEQVNIIFMLINAMLPDIFPDANDPTHTWYAPNDDLVGFSKEDSLFISRSFKLYLTEVIEATKSNNWQSAENVLESIQTYQIEKDAAQLIQPDKLKAEIRYNRLSIFPKTGQAYFLLGFLLLLITLISLFRPLKWMKYVSKIMVVGIVIVFIYHAYGMILRWAISGHAPWSNSYETMIYVAWATVLAGLIFGRKNFLTLSLAILFGGVIIFVSRLSWMDPEITTLVPVLKSPWLMFHVAVTIAAYGFFGIGFLLGIVNLLIIALSKKNHQLKNQVEELSIINNMALLVGLALMTIGTFLGGVWANESWGRYWSWDPKETWALITVVIYSIVTHLHLVRNWFNHWSFNFAAVLAFSSVIMTYLGVNYFLSGLHSYGENEGVSAMFSNIMIMFLVIMILGLISFFRRKNFKN